MFRRGIRMELFPSVAEFPPQQCHTHTAVLLHGFAQEPARKRQRRVVLPLEGELVLPLQRRFPGLRCVCPAAPQRQISCYSDDSPRMAAWYDYLSDFSGDGRPDLEEEIDADHVRQARQALHALLERELAPLRGDAQRLFVLGYSQGGCMALDAGLTARHELGGIIALRGHLMSATDVPTATERRTQRVLAYHGAEDETIGCALARRLSARVSAAGHALSFESQPGLGHGDLGCEAELSAIATFMSAAPGGPDALGAPAPAPVVTPTKAQTAFFLFMKEERPRIRKEHRDAKRSDVAKLGGERWRALTEEQKAQWKERASADRQRYSAEQAQWVRDHPEEAQREAGEKERRAEGKRRRASARAAEQAKQAKAEGYERKLRGLLDQASSQEGAWW